MSQEQLTATCECGVHNNVGLRFDDSVLKAVMQDCQHEFTLGKLKLENGSKPLTVKVSIEPIQN
ncbi:hypothetical protein [Bacillus sp. T33-2]|uniref:hypothetical protein n=1 Tax=Bacillus sp. T33-2 TaxID=2054168 RepID=UPI000C778AF6|nr:hypothetical protein [Bacillus sp. T33-2]PLR99482.1 hypothetical protein CVD19_00025 [Bacillus sp. T33-2]